MVRKIGTSRTQIPHRKRLRHFTTRQPIPDIQIKPRDWKPDKEVIIKPDDLYAGAWECEYEKPNSDSDYLIETYSPEITKLSAEAADEMSSTPGALREDSPEVCSQVDRTCDGTDTDHHMQPDVDTSVEQPDPTPTDPRSSQCDLHHIPKPNCNDDYRY